MHPGVMAGRFRGAFRVEFDDVDAGVIRSLEPLAWIVDYDDPDSEVVLVPAGSDSDGASKPRWSWFFLGHPFAHPRSALIHDYGYRNPSVRPQFRRGDRRSWWDRQYRRALEVEGASSLSAWFQWLGVRIGGLAHPRW